MKIEVDLLRMDQDTFKARCCAVAILSALPWDEAQAAVDEWRAVRQERLRGDDEPAAASVETQPDPTPAPAAEGSTAADAATTAGEACEACGGQVSRPGDLLCDACMRKAQPQRLGKVEVDRGDGTREWVAPVTGEGPPKPRRIPDYKVGGWVVAAAGTGQIVGISETSKSRFLKVTIDDGDQSPLEHLLHVDQVRPATTAEIGAAAALVEGPGEPEKKKRGRPKKADADAARANAEVEAIAEACTEMAAAEDQLKIDGKAAKYAKTSLRDLCKLAAHHAGRNKVMAMLTRQGVDGIAGLAPDKEAAVRASVLELVP